MTVATMDEVMASVIEPLRLLYRPRWDPDRDPVRAGQIEAAMIADILSQGFSATDLAAGMVAFRRDWIMARWPTIGELLAALRKTIPRSSGASRARSTPGSTTDPTEWAEAMMTRTEGREALRKGFSRELWCWAMDHPGQVPGEAVMTRLAGATMTHAAAVAEMRAKMQAAVGHEAQALRFGLIVARNMSRFQRALEEDFLPTP